MELQVNLGGRGERSAGVYRGLIAAILDGRLRPGERLPPTRELATRLAISRNTVTTAYERLAADGFLVSRVGSGTFVTTEALRSAGPPREASRPMHEVADPTAATRTARPGIGVTPRRLWLELAEPVTAAAAAPRYDFRVGVPDGELFPYETWRRLVTAELRRSTMDNVHYADPAGHGGLRAAIARHAGLARSVVAGADDVIVTQGAQQALDLVGRVLIDPGDIVAVEEPGYPEARLLFRSHGARVVGVPVDHEGIDVSAIPARARLIYVTPSHQFPLGTPMSLGRRTALLAWAQRHGAVIVEDDYDSEFRFSDRPLEPLQSLDRAGRVVYVGTFSKTLLPMLRLGFLVAPAALHPALRMAKRLTDWHGSLPIQAALARFIDEGLLGRHVRKATRRYADRHAIITETLRRDFAEWLHLVPSAAGLHLSAELRPDARVDLGQVLRTASDQGVGLAGLGGYFAAAGARRDGVVLGFGAIATADIAPALTHLSAAFRAAGVPTPLASPGHQPVTVPP